MPLKNIKKFLGPLIFSVQMVSECHVCILVESKGWLFVALAVPLVVVAIISKSDNLVRLAFDAD